MQRRKMLCISIRSLHCPLILAVSTARERLMVVLQSTLRCIVPHVLTAGRDGLV